MNVVSKIITACFGSLLLLITLFFLLSNLNFPSGYRIFLVQSGSMSPKINTGDLVVIRPNLEYKKGDIVTFLSTNKFNITHRIVDIKNDQIFTKGDANKTQDQEILSKQQILGKVFYTIPYFGYLIIFAKSIPGLIVLIIIPSTIIIYQELLQIQKNFKKIISQ